jgi:hypothetical protein
MKDCKDYELLTETGIEQVGETESGEAIGEPYQYPVGEVCHKYKTYNFDCEKCIDLDKER